jgi:2-haloacid dehalogenase
MKALAFDVFGTLLDVSAITKPLADVTADADGFAAGWRAKQLEYTFLLSSMGRFIPFGEITRRALRATAARAGVELSDARTDSLARAWTRLPPFPDVRPALERLRGGGSLAVLSNGDPRDLQSALTFAKLRDLLDPVVSASEVRRFKPAPDVYRHLATRLDRPAKEVVVVSANAFDALGAKAAGLRAVWVNRSDAPLDAIGLGPDLEVESLRDLTARDIASIR